MTLSKEELERYSRQLLIPGLGPEGQEKIKAAKVAVAGAGGLGSLVSGYLAGAGVGELGLFDFGPVELSNLHRQLIYRTGDIGTAKTELAGKFLLALNPGVKINVREGLLTAANAAEALAGYDFIADCTDNFTARAAVNKACFDLKKTYVHGAVYQLEGQLTVFPPPRRAVPGLPGPRRAAPAGRQLRKTGSTGPHRRGRGLHAGPRGPQADTGHGNAERPLRHAGLQADQLRGS